jgi:hypothetical protein
MPSAIIDAVIASSLMPALGSPKNTRKSWTMSGVLRITST